MLDFLPTGGFISHYLLERTGLKRSRCFRYCYKMHLSSACATPKLASILSCLNLVYTTQEGCTFCAWGLKHFYQSGCRHLRETRMPLQIHTRCTVGFSNRWLESNPGPSLTFSHPEIQALMGGKMSITTVLTRMKWGGLSFPIIALVRRSGGFKRCATFVARHMSITSSCVLFY